LAGKKTRPPLGLLQQEAILKLAPILNRNFNMNNAELKGCMSKRLENKVALITGGGSGIGKAACLRFASEGAFVFVVELNETSGQQVIDEIKANGGKGLFIRCDVSKSEDVRAIISQVENSCGHLDIIYNNASVYLPKADGPVTDIAEDAWDKIIAINLRSVYLLCKYGIPLLKKSGGGSIINTASSAGMIGIPNCDAYTASKGATVQLTKSMAVEFGRFGIRVNCISPAAIMTPMVRQSNPDDGSSAFDEEAFLNLRTPLRRYGTPEEIANVALFLASDESSYINGAVIVADGGITINGDLSKINKRDGN
jgi:NAD(P)-dependent dehydrogenase (short-subunit alcohol dehydrogenase family)